MANPITLLTPVNSLYLSDPNGLKVLGQAPFGVYGIQPWMAVGKYQSKYTFTDTITIQAQIEGNIPAIQTGNAKLYLCDYYDPNSGDYKLYGDTVYNRLTGSSIDLNIAPYLKGVQQIAGNFYKNPFLPITTPLKSYLWAFDFTTLGIATAGTYYLLLLNDKLNIPSTHQITYLFSEPFLVKAAHPNTMLFQSQFATNKADNWNVIVTGWYNDYPTNTQTFTPLYSLRIEGYLIDDDPSAVLVGYSQQLWEQVQTFSKLVRMKTLAIGELSTGIPPHMLEMVQAQILADTFWIDNYSYISPSSNNSTQLTKLWKSRRPNAAYPLFYAGTALMERFQAQGAIITPPPPIPSHYFAPDFFSGGFA